MKRWWMEFAISLHRKVLNFSRIENLLHKSYLSLWNGISTDELFILHRILTFIVWLVSIGRQSRKGKPASPKNNLNDNTYTKTNGGPYIKRESENRKRRIRKIQHEAKFGLGQSWEEEEGKLIANLRRMCMCVVCDACARWKMYTLWPCQTNWNCLLPLPHTDQQRYCALS